MKYFFLLFLLISGHLFSHIPPPQPKTKLQRRINKLSLKTSVIIPCHYLHFEHLFELLQAHCNQSVLPDEVVISLSGAKLINDEDIQYIKNFYWPFALQIICSDERKVAGENRNIACEAAVGDLIICIDADDLPHPQRTEIIKKIFENVDIEFLIHIAEKKSCSHFLLFRETNKCSS